MRKASDQRVAAPLSHTRKAIRPVVAAGITAALLLGYLLLGSRFTEAMWIITAVMMAIVLSVVMVLAGFAVLKSLSLVAAELSLLIFLAQSYCGVPGRSPEGDEALKALLVIGLLYTVVQFSHALAASLKQRYTTVRGERWSREKIVAVASYLIFTALFIRVIYLVMSPIVMNLCVFR